ncbi:PaaI family thioesterase [Saccharopolyspora mangrovi]|uniref:PaaI family thioesterase n=1 Tax=Saccharopolyspora mangrovi TaxID=3082379 RepID=A0ABU6AI58_9PSEU|nr:PaaI family thioesterase [Saccharopolyspora sp. S2-29]MEB3370995.1 PaaI family thioesterase [Saccharopolyspora sp. S2-29]
MDDRQVATLEMMRDQVIPNSPFTAFLGTEITVCSDGVAELEVSIRKDLTQHHGFAHGAIVGCVADNACTWAAASIVGDVVTTEYKLHLLAPAVGEKLIGRGRVLKASSRLVIAAGDVHAVTGEKEKHVATVLATIIPVTKPAKS